MSGARRRSMKTPVLEKVHPGSMMPKVDTAAMEFAAEVEKTTGYTRLQTANLSSDQRDLLSILREHNIHVYRPEDIEAYKSKMVFRAHGKYEIVGITSFFVGLGMLVALIAACVTSGIAEGALSAWTGWSAFGFGALLATAAASMGYCIYKDDHVLAEWNEQMLSHYRNEVPV